MKSGLSYVERVIPRMLNSGKHTSSCACIDDLQVNKLVNMREFMGNQFLIILIPFISPGK